MVRSAIEGKPQEVAVQLSNISPIFAHTNRAAQSTVSGKSAVFERTLQIIFSS
jgi:hypothetical protein